MDDLLVEIDARRPDAVVACAGEIDIATCSRVEEAVEACLGRETASLTLDCSRVSFFAACGVDLVLRTMGLCAARGIQFRLRLSSPARRVFDVLDMSWVDAFDPKKQILAQLEAAWNASSWAPRGA